MIDFNRLVGNYLKREVRPRKDGWFYPSEAGSCIRKAWYIHKRPLPKDPETLKRFLMGDKIHELVSDVLEKSRDPYIELLDTEVPLKFVVGDITISGRLDDMLLVKADGKKVVLEVKSVKDLRFKKTPDESHIMQLQLYMHASGVKNGIVMYVEKNTFNSKEFDIDYDKVVAEAAIQRFKDLHGFLKTNALPPPEAKQKEHMNWMCKVCEYRDRCDRNES